MTRTRDPFLSFLETERNKWDSLCLSGGDRGVPTLQRHFTIYRQRTSTASDSAAPARAVRGRMLRFQAFGGAD